MSTAVVEQPVETMPASVGAAIRSYQLPIKENGDNARTALIYEWLQSFYASQFAEPHLYDLGNSWQINPNSIGSIFLPCRWSKIAHYQAPWLCIHWQPT